MPNKFDALLTPKEWQLVFKNQILLIHFSEKYPSTKGIPDTYDIIIVLSRHVESVVLLSRKNPDDRIEIDLNLDELDITASESKATYEEIKDYVQKNHDLKVSSLYISQVKRKLGLEVGINYNHPKSEDARVPQCSLEKEVAITEALEYFRMI